MNPIKQRVIDALKQRIVRLVEVDPRSRCWIWKGATISTPRTKSKGYGYMVVVGKKVTVRRLAYKLYNGNPGNFTVNSTCGNSLCVNPDHLIITTRKKSPGAPTQEVESDA